MRTAAQFRTLFCVEHDGDASIAKGEQPTAEQVLAAAKRCFLRSGYDRATMRDIAREAGTSASRLYLSYESKQVLYLAVLAEASTRLVTEHLGPVLAEPDLSPWDRVMALTEAYLNFYVTNRDMARLLVLASIDPDDPHPLVQEMVRTQKLQMDAVMQYVEQLTADSGSDLNPAHVLRWAWAGVFGLAALNTRLPHLAIDDDELDRVVAVGMRLVRLGLQQERGLG